MPCTDCGIRLQRNQHQSKCTPCHTKYHYKWEIKHYGTPSGTSLRRLLTRPIPRNMTYEENRSKSR
jgi:hypothetical protein